MAVCVLNIADVEAEEAKRASAASDAQAQEEPDWLPNPYQALADAQVAAGAWPGSPMLIQGTPMLVGAGHSLPGAHIGSCWVPDVLITADADSYWSSAASSCGGTAPWNVCNDFSSGSLADCETNAPSCRLGYSAADSSEQHSSGRSTPVGPLEVEGCGGAAGRPTAGYPRRLSHRCVPKAADLRERHHEDAEHSEVTTLMIRNIPNVYTRAMLVEELGSLRLDGAYDFLYLPIDKSTQWNVGYAFVNFLDHRAAEKCRVALQGFNFKRDGKVSHKVALVSTAHIQGLEANLAHYENAAVNTSRKSSSVGPVVMARLAPWTEPRWGEVDPLTAGYLATGLFLRDSEPVKVESSSVPAGAPPGLGRAAPAAPPGTWEPVPIPPPGAWGLEPAVIDLAATWCSDVAGAAAFTAEKIAIRSPPPGLMGRVASHGLIGGA
mmetsp:Transcript_8373/g.22421  ORF Transcript_8373/g.22421 Transcript_8373/m.22421 type:complete len:436 (-) Transcript_8373:104-1411(-)